MSDAIRVVVALAALLDLVQHPAPLGVADEGPVLLEGRRRGLVAVDHRPGLGVLHPVARAALQEGHEAVLVVVGHVDDADDLDVVELEVLDAVDAVLALEALELQRVALVERAGDVGPRRRHVARRPRGLHREEAFAHARLELLRGPVAVAGLRDPCGVLGLLGPLLGRPLPLRRRLRAAALRLRLALGRAVDEEGQPEREGDRADGDEQAQRAELAVPAAAAARAAAEPAAAAREPAAATTAAAGGPAGERPRRGRDGRDEQEHEDRDPGGHPHAPTPAPPAR